MKTPKVLIVGLDSATFDLACPWRMQQAKTRDRDLLNQSTLESQARSQSFKFRPARVATQCCRVPGEGFLCAALRRVIDGLIFLRKTGLPAATLARNCPRQRGLPPRLCKSAGSRLARACFHFSMFRWLDFQRHAAMIRVYDEAGCVLDARPNLTS